MKWSKCLLKKNRNVLCHETGILNHQGVAADDNFENHNDENKLTTTEWGFACFHVKFSYITKRLPATQFELASAFYTSHSKFKINFTRTFYLLVSLHIRICLLLHVSMGMKCKFFQQHLSYISVHTLALFKPFSSLLLLLLISHLYIILQFVFYHHWKERWNFSSECIQAFIKFTLCVSLN